MMPSPGRLHAVIIGTLGLLCALCIGGCERQSAGAMPSARAAPASASASAADHEAGRKIYNFRCYYCHGYSGDAKTLATSYLAPKPVDFTATAPAALSRERMLHSIREGRAGTAMAGFRGILTPREMERVADFVREEFMNRKAENTRYHTAANGWPQHERYRDAYPFATGETGVDTPWEQLEEKQAAGKRLYLASCVSCHDRGRATADAVAWELRAVSYPRNQDSCTTCHGADGKLRPSASHMAPPPDAIDQHRPHPQQHAGAQGPHAKHDTPPNIATLSPLERRGETVYQKNCAFCHAADGTGRNWIGAFLEPHPRDLTDAKAMAALTGDRLTQAIRDGVAGSSMPAWKAVLAEPEIRAVAAYVARAFYPGSR